MKRHNRLYAFLAVLLAVLTVSACGGGSDAPAAATTAPSVSSQTEEEAATASNKLPPRDMNGYTLTMAKLDQSKIQNATVTFCPEEMTGDMINDDIYNRNLRLTEEYNFKLSEVSMTDMAAQINNLVMTDDTTYDVFFHSLKDIGPNCLKGFFLDLNTVPSLYLGERWWDQGLRENLSIMNRQYFMVGDVVLSMLDCVHLLYYNKQLAEDLGIKGLYEMVREGKWTYERMGEMMELAVADLDGDGVMGPLDRYGLLHNATSVQLLYAATGGHICKLDKEGKPYVSALEESSQNAASAVRKLFEIPGATRNYSNFASIGFETVRIGIVNVFSNNSVLFYSNGISAAAQYMRDVPVDYGFLPAPKYNEEQEFYYSQVTYGAPVLVLPRNCRHAEEAGFVLEVLARDSWDSVVDDYLNTLFSAKYVRDEESFEMLTIALEHHNFDIGSAFGWGGLSNAVITMLEKGGDTLVSTVESRKAATEKEIADFLADGN